MADAASAPLDIKASAAASLLRDGVPGEDVGAAAGLANPNGEAWDPVSLARLADAVVRKLRAAAAADARDAGPSADDAWNEDGGEDESGDDGGWWDPESLAALLCALAGSHRGSRARLGGDIIEPKDQATLAHSLVRTHEWEHANVGDLLWCIHACTSGDSSPLTSMDRVEEAAEVVLELARPRRPGPGCGLGWSVDEASSLLPAVLPAPHWCDDGLVGMSAVKGSALLAAALAAGGRAGVETEDGGGAMGRFAEDQRWAHPHRTFPSVDDDHAAESGTGAWSVGAIAGALRHVLDEDGGDAWLEDEEGTGAGAFEDEEDGGGEGGLLAGLATDARGRSLAPRLGPEALAGSGRRGKPRGGGWDARNVALLAAELHGNFAWDVEPAARLAAEVLGWEGADPDSAAAAAATLRSPHVGWSAPKTAEALTAMRVASAAGPATNEWPDADEVRWDAHGLVAPMCEALVGEHGWRVSDVLEILDELAVWDVQDACGLVTGLSDWDDDALASLLDGLITWRGRDREEVATVAATLRAARGWTGGGALGKALGVAAGAVAEGSSEWGLGGGATPEWPPAPPDGHETVEEDDGYAAGAD